MILEWPANWPAILNLNYITDRSPIYFFPPYVDCRGQTDRQSWIWNQSIWISCCSEFLINGVFNLNLIFEILYKNDSRITNQLNGNLELEFHKGSVKPTSNLEFEISQSESHVVLKSWSMVSLIWTSVLKTWTKIILEWQVNWPAILADQSPIYFFPPYLRWLHRSNRPAILNLKSVNLFSCCPEILINGIFNLNLSFEILDKNDFRITGQLTGNLEFELVTDRSPIYFFPPYVDCTGQTDQQFWI